MPRSCNHSRNSIRAVDRRHIDDGGAGCGLKHLEDRLLLLLPIHGPHDLEGEVLALDATIDHLRAGYGKALEYVPNAIRRCSRRQRKDGRTPEFADHVCKMQIGGSKIVSPLADAMGFVDDEQGDAALPQRFDMLRIQQTLRGEQHDVARSAANSCSSRRCCVVSSVESSRAASDIRLLEMFQLVLHECDEGRDDHHGAFEKQRGQLVAQRLAGAGRQDTERIATGKNV